MNHDLFATSIQGPEALQPGAFLLRGFVGERDQVLLNDLQSILAVAPWRQMRTPGGQLMSVAMSNCGALGWVSDRAGYRYQAHDPLSGGPWPQMPASFVMVAKSAAVAAGFNTFLPDVCLMNRYEPDTRLTLHQDKDERDFMQPIVSVSLGVSATFMLGGLQRQDQVLRTELHHGDIVVWGGPSRLRYHGIQPLKPAQHPLTGHLRINLTFRVAG